MRGIKKATGKPVKIRFVEITSFESGEIKEDWLIVDSMAFGQQLGQ
jgi:predicted ester cyclase